MDSSNFFGDAVGIYKDNEKIYVGVVDQGTKEIFIFEKNINSGFERGAAITVEIEGEKVIDLWGGVDSEEENTTRQ